MTGFMGRNPEKKKEDGQWRRTVVPAARVLLKKRILNNKYKQ